MIKILVFFLLITSYCSASQHLSDKLHVAFERAFSSPEHFEDSQVFQLLDYKDDEINLIRQVTPRPQKIELTYKQKNEPGTFEKLKVVAYGVTYYNLLITRAVFSFPDSKICLDQLEKGYLKFLKLDKVGLQTEVTDKDLLGVFELVARARSLYNLRMTMNNDRVHMRGRTRRGLFVAEFRLDGQALLEDSRTIVFNCNRLILNGQRLPRNVVGRMFDAINPVFDANNTWLNLHIDQITVDKGKVTSKGRIERRES